MNDYIQGKIDFICKSINTSNADIEFKGAVLDLIKEIQSDNLLQIVKSKSFSVGFVAGASNQVEHKSVVDNVSENLQRTYNIFKDNNLI